MLISHLHGFSARSLLPVIYIYTLAYWKSMMLSAYLTPSTTINPRAVRRPSWCQPAGQHHQWSTPEQPNFHHVVNLLDIHHDVGLLDIHHDVGLLDSITNDQLQSSETSIMMSAYWTASPMINSRAVKHPSWCRPTGQHHQRSAPEQWNIPHVGLLDSITKDQLQSIETSLMMSAYRTASPMINSRAVKRPPWSLMSAYWTSIMLSAYWTSINNDQPQSSETSIMMLAYWTPSPKISSRAACRSPPVAVSARRATFSSEIPMSRSCCNWVWKQNGSPLL